MTPGGAEGRGPKLSIRAVRLDEVLVDVARALRLELAAAGERPDLIVVESGLSLPPSPGARRGVFVVAPERLREDQLAALRGRGAGWVLDGRACLFELLLALARAAFPTRLDHRRHAERRGGVPCRVGLGGVERGTGEIVSAGLGGLEIALPPALLERCRGAATLEVEADVGRRQARFTGRVAGPRGPTIVGLEPALDIAPCAPRIAAIARPERTRPGEGRFAH